MSADPLISVLVTSYNHERFIRQCIDSLLNQTYPHVRIRVVDDASTDGTVDILRGYGDRIELAVRKRNLGVEAHAETINQAIRTAEGELFYRIDSDDFIARDYFERLVDAWREDPTLDWICGGVNVVDAEGRVLDTWDYRDWPTDPDAAIARGWQTCSVLMPHNGLFRTDFLRANDVYFEHFPYGWGEDVYFTLKGMLAGAKVRLIPYPGFNWRTHGENNSTDVVRRLKLVLAVKEYYAEHIPTDRYLKHPLLDSLPAGTPDYEAAKWFLIAADLYTAKHRFQVPGMFSDGSTAAQIDENRHLFDDLIRRYAERSRECSPRFSREVEMLLEKLAADGRVQEGRRLLRLGDFRAAVDRFSEVTRRDSSRGDAWRGLGEAAFAVGDIRKARDATERAVQLAPGDAEALNNLAVIACAQGETDAAERHLMAAMEHSPRSNDVHVNLLRVLAARSRQAILTEDRRARLAASVEWLTESCDDPSRHSLQRRNRELRAEALGRYRGMYHEPERIILLHYPPNGALRYLMESWAEVLTFMGARAALLPWGGNHREALSGVSKGTLITVADPAWLGTLDRDDLRRRRRSGQLKVGVITTLEHGADPVDFYVTFHLDPSRDPRYAGLDRPLVSLPFAANPLRHFMRKGTAVWDYFFVGTNSPLKAADTAAWLMPVVEQSDGLLAGVGWEHGAGELPVEVSARCYNLAAVCPNYHLSAQRDEFNEVNERTYVIPACGAFELVDQPSALGELFTADEMASAATPAEYRDMFDYFLRHPDARIPYVEKGMERVWREYTLFHVLARLLEFLEYSRPEGRPAAVAGAGEVRVTA